jgi:hypothetical protein
MFRINFKIEQTVQRFILFSFDWLFQGMIDKFISYLFAYYCIIIIIPWAIKIEKTKTHPTTFTLKSKSWSGGQMYSTTPISHGHFCLIVAPAEVATFKML